MPPAALLLALVAALAGWAVWALIARAVLRGGPPGDAEAAVVMAVFRWYSALVHGLRVEGREHVPGAARDGGRGPLVVIANHTAGVDPILVQAALPMRIRWLMAQDMRIDVLDGMWEIGRVIFVDRRTGDSVGVRDAMRHLKRGGTIGLFPEGHLERPPRQVLPFLPGVGLLIARTGARVLPLVVDGAPQVDPAWSSLWRPSRATVRILPPIEPGSLGRRPDEIASALREMYLRETGWPANEVTPRLVEGHWEQVDVRGRWREVPK